MTEEENEDVEEEGLEEAEEMEGDTESPPGGETHDQDGDTGELENQEEGPDKDLDLDAGTDEEQGDEPVDDGLPQGGWTAPGRLPKRKERVSSA